MDFANSFPVVILGGETLGILTISSRHFGRENPRNFTHFQLSF